MKTWGDWSDGDINWAICEKLKLNPFARVGDTCEVVCDINGESAYKDYCNSWSDMGPICLDNGIVLGKYEGDGFAFCNFRGGVCEELWDFMHYNKNPIRAAAIVLLEMNGVKP